MVLIIAALLLVITICCQVEHLACTHILTDDSYLNEILSGVIVASVDVNLGDTEEALLRKFNATNCVYLTKDEILDKFPRCKQGRYTDFLSGGHSVLNWEIYDIDSLCDYVGRIEVGKLHGKLKVIRIAYSTEGE